MSSSAWSRIAQGLKVILLAVAAGYALMVLALAVVRVPYPFELEWMEGGSLQQLQRILAGEKLYVAPSIEFIPFIYPPLYYYVSALVAKVVGIGFAPLRLVSLAASVGSAALIAVMVRREGGTWLPGLLAGGLFLATYRFSGAWFDVGRVDALFLGLFLAGMYGARFYPSLRGGVVTGVMFALACLTKQLALAMALPIVAAAALANWRRGVVMAVTLALAAGGATWAIDAFHGGWYRFYVFETLAGHSLETSMFVGFWTRDLARPLAIAGMAALAWLASRWRAGDRGTVIFYLAAGIAMVGGSYGSRLNFGGYANVLLWAYAWLAIVAGLGFQAMLTWIVRSGEASRARRQAGLYAVAIAQFAALAYWPLAHAPTTGDADAGHALVQRLRELPGPVWVPYHPYLAAMAGHPNLAHGMATVELLWGRGQVVDGLRRELDAAIANQRFGAIVLDGGWFPAELESGITRSYREAGHLIHRQEAFYPVTGMRTRPEVLYVKRRQDQSAPLAPGRDVVK